MNEELKAQIRLRLELIEKEKKINKFKQLREQIIPVVQDTRTFSGSDYSSEVLDLVKESMPAILDLAREVTEFIDDEGIKRDLESSQSIQEEFSINPDEKKYTILAKLVKRISIYLSSNDFNL